MSQWIYRIEPTRPGLVGSRTDEESSVLAERAGYLRALKDAGILILAGRTRVEEGAFGVTVFEAPDEASARAVMRTDPAVSAGVMRAELYPYAVAGSGDALDD
ncbi:YciI family protein [uncultured Microbacterium sp.]|uniref:YciI family protein n=1 Tax=uncultured Microbacterium sp. TaxID=191216 RepID=UPI0028D74342|nr:YciI family protein [uncultured Microbacterium sp.]